MKSFREFLSEAVGTLKASGAEAARHKKKYLDPHIGFGKFSHTTAVEYDELPAGSKVKIHGVSQDAKGRNIVHVIDEHGNHHHIPANHLNKPGEEKPNKGHQYEADFITHLKKHKVMPQHISGAGSTSGTDFVIENKKKKVTHNGKVTGELLNGETKQGVTAALGQLTIKHSTEKGWHIDDETRAKRPGYAAEIEKAGILDHMNRHHNPDKHEIKTTESGRAESITLKHPNLNPGEAYLKDHHVHILQVGTHGTYRVGDKDATGHGLPSISGKGKWTIREKQTGNKKARTVMFQPDGVHGLNKSHVNLDKPEHMEAFKKTLGITE